MSEEQTQVTRDLNLYENKDGYWFFTISEAGQVVHESDLFQNSLECSQAGMAFLDILHDAAPLRCDHVHPWEE